MATMAAARPKLVQNLYPKTPDMRLPATQGLTDGDLYYIIRNGVRLTGMPAWGTEEKDDDRWKLVLFIRHLPQLTPAEERGMESLNPKGPAEKQEQQEEEQFLKGEPEEQAPEQPTIRVPRSTSNETCNRGSGLSLGNIGRRICPWQREACDGLGHQHLGQLHCGGDYIKENALEARRMTVAPG
jgi:hypothetical protein